MFHIRLRITAEKETFREETNVLEAINNGAVAALTMILVVVANLIAFIALLAFLNSVISWFGGLIGHDEWSFEVYFSDF